MKENKMIKQLLELLEMQRTLDNAILVKKGVIEYPLEKMKIALFVELGELMNEFSTKFKYWKSSAVDNREKGLIEYVDCLHFVLSLCTQQKDFTTNGLEFDNCKLYGKDSLARFLIFIGLQVEHGNYKTALYDLFKIGNDLGFSWQEIYDAYMKKNKINYERLRSGY